MDDRETLAEELIIIESAVEDCIVYCLEAHTERAEPLACLSEIRGALALFRLRLGFAAGEDRPSHIWKGHLRSDP
jgi:hypothetical protein